MIYFWNTLQIVGGILFPIAIVYLLIIGSSFTRLWASCAEEAKAKAELAAKLEGHWVIDEIKRVPNPKMSQIVLRNCSTQDRLTFSDEKEKFREAA